MRKIARSFDSCRELNKFQFGVVVRFNFNHRSRVDLADADRWWWCCSWIIGLTLTLCTMHENLWSIQFQAMQLQNVQQAITRRHLKLQKRFIKFRALRRVQQSTELSIFTFSWKTQARKIDRKVQFLHFSTAQISIVAAIWFELGLVLLTANLTHSFGELSWARSAFKYLIANLAEPCRLSQILIVIRNQLLSIWKFVCAVLEWISVEHEGKLKFSLFDRDIALSSSSMLKFLRLFCWLNEIEKQKLNLKLLRVSKTRNLTVKVDQVRIKARRKATRLVIFYS